MIPQRRILRSPYALTVACPLLILLAAHPSAGQPFQAWEARYNGPCAYEYVSAVVTDGAGNVYVTGGTRSPATETDFLTVKYGPDGTFLWEKRYNGPANGEDGAAALAVDGEGNLYVTGRSARTKSPGYYVAYDYNYDYLTIKYDPDGNVLWMKRYFYWTGDGDFDDVPTALAVDGSGNVLITGYIEYAYNYVDCLTIKYAPDGTLLWARTRQSNCYYLIPSIAVDPSGNTVVAFTYVDYGWVTGEDCRTVKYDPDGNELWTATYNGPGDGMDYPAAVAVDSVGAVYVTGSSEGDYITLKYDADGNELWAERYDGPMAQNDRATALALDSSGNVHVTGTSNAYGDSENYTTVKYDTDGNELWVAHYDGPMGQSDRAVAVAVDPLGRVYVTGTCNGTGTDEFQDYATIRYSPEGSEVWVAHFDGPAGVRDFATALALDDAGNIVVSGGSVGRATCEDYGTVKYDPDGNELWTARYSSPSGTGEDRATCLVLNESVGVTVSGFTKSGGSAYDYDYMTIRYSSSGDAIWSARYNGPGNEEDYAHAVEVDGSGNVFVTGESRGTSIDYATVKYDAGGNELWVARYNGPGSASDKAADIALDAAGNVYVSGESSGDGSNYDFATVKYAPDGNELWVARYDGPVSSYDKARALALDGAGNVYVTGESPGDGSSYDYATVKYNPDGNQLWVARYNGPGNSWDEPVSLAVDVSGNAYVTGRSRGTSTEYDYATVKYDPDGNELWVARYDGPVSLYDRAKALALDGAGNVYVTGESVGDGTYYDYATVKYAPDGNELWVARYNGSGDSRDVAAAIVLGSSGFVYVVGTSSVAFSEDLERDDYVMVKYDPDGNQVLATRYIGTGTAEPLDFVTNEAVDLAVDGQGDVYVTGTSIGNGTGYDYATVKYTNTFTLWALAFPPRAETIGSESVEMSSALGSMAILALPLLAAVLLKRRSSVKALSFRRRESG